MRGTSGSAGRIHSILGIIGDAIDTQQTETRLIFDKSADRIYLKQILNNLARGASGSVGRMDLILNDGRSDNRDTLLLGNTQDTVSGLVG